MVASPPDSARGGPTLVRGVTPKLGACCLALSLLAACYQPQLPRDEPDEPIATGASPSSADDGGTARPIKSPVARGDKPVVSRGGPDAGQLDAGELDAGTPSLPPVPAQHAACLLPMPPAGELPASPTAADAISQPPATVDCANAAPVFECDDDLGCPFVGSCLKPERGARGICVKSGGVSLGHASGACVTWVAPEFKAAACCAGVTGLDCRAWPIADGARAGVPGELCQLHDDCEPGLLCGSTSDARWGKGWGRCVCPGVDAASLFAEIGCESPSSPNPWGNPDEKLPATCVPAKTPGWVIEVAAEEALGHFAVAADGQGQLHMISTSFETLHSVRSTSGWTSEAIDDAWFSYVAMAVDSAGHAHLIGGAINGSQATYGTNASGTWTLEVIGGSEGAGPPQIVIDKANVPHVSYYDEAVVDLRYLTRQAGTWKEYLVTRERSFQQAMLYVNDTLTWVHGDDYYNLFRVTRNGESFPRSPLTNGMDVSVASTKAGDLLLAFQSDSTRAQLIVARVTSDKLTEQVVWSQDNPRFEGFSVVLPALAISNNDQPWIAHSAPEGILLQTYENKKWSAIQIADKRAQPKLVVDSEGEPHVFYQDWYGIRHAFRGTCPTDLAGP